MWIEELRRDLSGRDLEIYQGVNTTLIQRARHVGAWMAQRDGTVPPPYRPRTPPPGHGPGTELTALLSSLGFKATENCDCKRKARQMDSWAVQGCRENLGTIVDWMREVAAETSWLQRSVAAGRAVLSGLAFRLDMADPMPSLVREAIRRAEAKQANRSGA